MEKILVEIKKEELMSALKKTGMVKTEALSLIFYPKKGYGNITASDGSVQVSGCFFFEEIDCEKDVEEIIVGTEFNAVCETMAPMSEKFILEVSDTDVVIRCGKAKSSVGRKKEMRTMVAIKDENTISLKMETSLLKRAIQKGGYRSMDDNSRGLKNVLSFIPMLESAEAPRLECFTTDMYVIAMSTVDIKEVSKTTDEYLSYALPSDRMLLMTGLLDAEETEVFLNTEQLMFRNGNNFFLFQVYDRDYPKEMHEKFMNNDFSQVLELNKKELEMAVSLANLSLKEREPVILSGKEDQISVCGKGETVTQIDSKGAEFDEIGFNPDFLKAVIKRTDGDIIKIGFSSQYPFVNIAGEEKDDFAYVAPVSLKK